MIARIIAILASDGFSVEAAKFGIKRSTSCNVGLCLLVLVCISICFVMITCPSAAVLAQFDQGGLGKESRKEKKERKDKERKEKIRKEWLRNTRKKRVWKRGPRKRLWSQSQQDIVLKKWKEDWKNSVRWPKRPRRADSCL